ncbi:hypothetical protein Ancab_004317 [Ancistrocladus abbreviatus]
MKLSIARRAYLEETSTTAGNNLAPLTSHHETSNVMALQGDGNDDEGVRLRVEHVGHDDHEKQDGLGKEKPDEKEKQDGLPHSHEGYGHTLSVGGCARCPICGGCLDHMHELCFGKKQTEATLRWIDFALHLRLPGKESSNRLFKERLNLPHLSFNLLPLISKATGILQGDDDDVDKVKSRVEPVDDNEAHSHKSYGSTYYNNDGVGSAYGWGSGGLNTPVSRSGSLSHCPVSPRHCLDPPTPTFGCSSCGHGWGFTTDNNGEYEQVGLDIQREATTAQKTADNIQKKFTVIKPHSILASRSAITPNHVDSPGPIPRAQKDVQLHELYFWRDGGEPDPRG